MFTGELHPYDAKKASWGRPEVDHPFSFEDDGIGAWELAASYCTVSLNSDVISGAGKRHWRGLWRPAADRCPCLSWYLNEWLRFMLQFQYVEVTKLNPAGKIQIGQRFETIAGRVQATW